MTDLIDAMLLEGLNENHSATTNYTTLEKIDQIYVMMKLTTFMVAMIVGFIMMVSFTIIMSAVGDHERAQLRKAKAKGEKVNQTGECEKAGDII